MHSSAAPESARYDRYQALMKNDRGPRPSAQEGFDQRFPFIGSSRPSEDRSMSAQSLPTMKLQDDGGAGSQKAGLQQAAVGYQGGHPQQHLHHQQLSGGQRGASPSSTMSVPKMPQIQRQNSLSRMGDRLLHKPPLIQATSYDANYNPLPAASPNGSRAASSAPSVSAIDGVEKKKKGFLKKAFK